VRFLAAALALTLAPASGPGAAWPQWGGPNRNFVTAAADLAPSWPAAGPRRLWTRPIGDGFSSIVTDGATVYTLARDGADDAVVALDAMTGTPRWTTKYAAPFKETCSERLGPAPRAAPLVAGDRLITISAGGLMNSVERTTGTIRWTRDVLEGRTPVPLALARQVALIGAHCRAMGTAARSPLKLVSSR